jgi:aminoglycoside 2'-N-acetyltransferase I
MIPSQKTPFHLDLLASTELTAATRQEINGLCSRAFEEAWQLEAMGESQHILGWLDGQLVTHGMWVTRWLQVGDDPLLHTAYVEGVVTELAYRNRGLATAVMQRIAHEIKDYELGGLSPFSVAYYKRLGWEKWRGPLFIRSETGLIKTPTMEGECVMILRLPQTPPLNLDAPLSAEWRPGELW